MEGSILNATVIVNTVAALLLAPGSVGPPHVAWDNAKEF